MTDEEFRKAAENTDPWGILRIDENAKVMREVHSPRYKGAWVAGWVWVEDQTENLED